MNEENEQSSDLWIDIVIDIKALLEKSNPNDCNFDYSASVKVYENAINEIIARKGSYTGSPLEVQADALIEEFEQKKKTFEEKIINSTRRD